MRVHSPHADGRQLSRQGSSVGRCFVGVDDRGFLPVFQAVHRLAQEVLRRCRIACRREIEVDRVPMLVDGPVKLGPLAPDLHGGLIDAPAGRTPRPPLPARPFLHLGCVSLNPTIDRRMVDQDAALAHHLPEIATAHSVSAIPTDRPAHDLTLKVTPFEVRHDAVDPSLEPYPDRQSKSLQQTRLKLAPLLPAFRN